MFQVKAPESFKSTLTIVGHGREQKLNLTYRHLSVPDYASLLERLGDDTLSVAQAILDIVVDWDADVALDTAGVEPRCSSRPAWMAPSSVATPRRCRSHARETDRGGGGPVLAGPHRVRADAAWIEGKALSAAAG